MKKTTILLTLVLCFTMLGCTKKEKYENCQSMILKVGSWEKKSDISTIYTFTEGGKGTAHINNLDYFTSWTINDNTIDIQYSLDDISFDHSYTLSCDLDDIKYILSDSSGNAEFVKKGSQVIKKLSGTKSDDLKGIWYNESGVSYAFDSSSKSGSGLYQTEDKVFYILTHYDWVNTENEIIMQNSSTGAKNTYTYNITDGSLKMYKDGTLYGTFIHDKDGYTIE